MAKDIAAAAQDTVTDVTNQSSTWVQQLKELAINNGLNCVYAIVILIFGIWFAGIFGRGITKFMTNRKIDPTISKFVGNIIKYGKRAGLKEGESVEKDVNKFNHYKEMLDNFEHGRPILGETRKEIRTSDEDGEKRESVFREG